MSDCMTQKRCRKSCRSMGAARYRWFHAQGCCQCIGHTCLHYGKGEAMCLRCSLTAEEVLGAENGIDESHQEKHKNVDFN